MSDICPTCGQSGTFLRDCPIPRTLGEMDGVDYPDGAVTATYHQWLCDNPDGRHRTTTISFTLEDGTIVPLSGCEWTEPELQDDVDDEQAEDWEREQILSRIEDNVDRQIKMRRGE